MLQAGAVSTGVVVEGEEDEDPALHNLAGPRYIDLDLFTSV